MIEPNRWSGWNVMTACDVAVRLRWRSGEGPVSSASWLAQCPWDLSPVDMLGIVRACPILIIKRDRDTVGISRGGDSGDKSRMTHIYRQIGTHNLAESLSTSPQAVVAPSNSPKIHPRRACTDMDNFPGYPAFSRCTYTSNCPVFHDLVHLSADLSTFCCGWWMTGVATDSLTW